MSNEDELAGFEALAQAGAEDDAEAARSLAARYRTDTNPELLKALAALWLHASAAAPEGLARIYDGAARGWTGEPVDGAPIRAVLGLAPVPIPTAFWKVIWALVTEADGIGSTPRAGAALGEILPAELIARAEHMAKAYPSAGGAGPSLPYDPKALARCPPGSLGEAFLALPTNTSGSPSLRRRDFWRLAAGYEATALHEMAFAAFQLAQTGHPAPGRYLAILLTRVAFEQPAGGQIVLAAILTAWIHGRRGPPLGDVRWEKLWDLAPDEARAKLGLAPYASPFPADIFERAAVAI